jgi:hypothetical protein
MTNDVDEMSAGSRGSRPFPKVSPERLLEILRMNCESGDILCGDAADEIERLRLTDEERDAIRAAVAFFSRGYGTTADTLRGLLERLG